MLRAFRSGLLWALGLAGLTTLLFEGMSYGFAHGNVLLIGLFLGVAAADSWALPASSLVTIFGYQLAYFGLLAFLVVAIRALVRGRRQRLEAERNQAQGT
jgi:hypothetical protein